jgi:hypothetical protein
MLAHLPELAPPGVKVPVRDYSPHRDSAAIDAAKQSIKIVHEDVDVTPEFEQAIALIRSSRSIAFLGFGFHPRNVQRLKLADAPGPPVIYGTIGQELTEAELHVDVRPLFTGINRDDLVLFDKGQRCNFVRDFLKKNRGVFAG